MALLDFQDRHWSHSSGPTFQTSSEPRCRSNQAKPFVMPSKKPWNVGSSHLSNVMCGGAPNLRLVCRETVFCTLWWISGVKLVAHRPDLWNQPLGLFCLASEAHFTSWFLKSAEISASTSLKRGVRLVGVAFYDLCRVPSCPQLNWATPHGYDSSFINRVISCLPFRYQCLGRQTLPHWKVMKSK